MSTKKTTATETAASAEVPVAPAGGSWVVETDGTLKESVPHTAPPPEPKRPERKG